LKGIGTAGQKCNSTAILLHSQYSRISAAWAASVACESDTATYFIVLPMACRVGRWRGDDRNGE
jgi:hypothetical protein